MPIVYRNLNGSRKFAGLPWTLVLSGKLSDKNKDRIAGGFAHLCTFPTESDLMKKSKFRKCLETGKRDVFAVMKCLEIDAWREPYATQNHCPQNGEEYFESVGGLWLARFHRFYRIHFDPKTRKDSFFWIYRDGIKTRLESADLVFFSCTGCAYLVEV